MIFAAYPQTSPYPPPTVTPPYPKTSGYLKRTHFPGVFAGPGSQPKSLYHYHYLIVNGRSNQPASPVKRTHWETDFECSS